MRHLFQRVEGDFETTELAYLEWGDPQSERTVLAVHGLTRNAHDFDVLAKALSARARVIAVDIAGRGDSRWLADKSAYDVPTYAAHMTVFMETLDLTKVDWVGTSMGGLIALLLAPGPNSPIERLVINDIGPLVSAETLDGIRSHLGLDLIFSSLDEVEQHLRFIHAGFGPLTDQQWRHLAKHSARLEGDSWRLHYDPEIRVPFLSSTQDDIDLWDQYDAIRCPTFLLHGADSALLAVDTVQEMARRGPKAKVMTLPGVGHAPALMSEDQVSAIYDFLFD